MTAPDAKLLREALDAHEWRYGARGDRNRTVISCSCGWRETQNGIGMDQWRDHREAAVRAALSAAPVAAGEGLTPTALAEVLYRYYPGPSREKDWQFWLTRAENMLAALASPPAPLEPTCPTCGKPWRKGGEQCGDRWHWYRPPAPPDAPQPERDQSHGAVDQRQIISPAVGLGAASSHPAPQSAAWPSVSQLAKLLEPHFGPGYFPGTNCVCVIVKADQTVRDAAERILATPPQEGDRGAS